MGTMSVAALVNSFDDIVKATSVLTEGIEADFFKFVTNQEFCRTKWLAAEDELIKYKQENAKLKAAIDTLEIKLKHARNQVDIEMKKRMKAEAGMDQMENNIVLIKELLCDKDAMSRMDENARHTLMQLSQCHNDTHISPKKRVYHDESSGSILSPSDVSIDPSADDLDTSYLRSGKKWTRPAVENGTDVREEPAPIAEVEEDGPTPPKVAKITPHQVPYQPPTKHMHEVPEEPIQTAPLAPITDMTETPNSNLVIHNKRVGLYPSLGEFIDTTPTAPHGPVSRPPPGNFNYTPSDSPMMQILSDNKSKTKKKNHAFQSKTVIKPESCIVCGRKITFSKLALKCRDCRGVCHPDCKDRMPLPCVPVLHTPVSGKKGQDHGIEFYAPAKSPMVPDIVVRCIQEVERRGLNEVGIYRVPGAEVKVKDLKEKFLRGKTSPDLNKIADIHVVCGTVKDFLRNLSEPLVTFKLHGEFVDAGSKTDSEDSACAMYQVVSKLAQPNRDTLAYVIRHLQRVVQCPDCKMTTVNLARVFGPTLVGHNCTNPEPVQMLQDTKSQPKVVECLLSLPSDYWNQFLSSTDENLVSPPYNPNTHFQDGTPIIPPAPYSMLGPLEPSSGTPVNSNSVKKKGSFLSKTPLTPRFGSKSKRANKRPNHFFSSLSSPNLPN